MPISIAFDEKTRTFSISGLTAREMADTAAGTLYLCSRGNRPSAEIVAGLCVTAETPEQIGMLCDFFVACNCTAAKIALLVAQHKRQNNLATEKSQTE